MTCSLLMEVLLDKDRKSRENSASRLEDLNFEKLYLRNRIVRLCRIIGMLRIDEAASVLVNIYNYLKKYPDTDILDADGAHPVDAELLLHARRDRNHDDHRHGVTIRKTRCGSSPFLPSSGRST